MQYTPEFQVSIPDPTLPGLMETITAMGLHIEGHTDQNGTKFYSDNPTSAAVIVGSYDPLPYTKSQAIAGLAAKYRAVQAGGHVTATVPALSILTDRDNVQAMMLAYMLVQADASQVYVFQDATGAWRSLNKAQTLTLLSDFAIWRKTVDQRAMAIAAQIAGAATWQAVQAIDVTANWPG